ncbi:hypothetical protein NP493_138g01010 [Ridgeia piscesae]|uniref:NADH dehydrogenase [ubiquinone] 1 alpha subcomplex subunit 9, mitochondrial n=1 Tax=Ridgeia piscesae TaxID=27915 RepID=A0AAD9UG63_RIDPI|nr:hypothetical protein NP493_138g01010 [Ridgeia piscesae]
MAALTLPAKSALRAGRHHVTPALGAIYVSKRDRTDIARGHSLNLANYKRGTGGRSSFSGIVATVFGASGFMGRYVVNRLGRIGSQIITPYRGDPYWMRDLKVAGDLGQVISLPYDMKDDDSIRRAMKYSNVVINLIGRDWETKNYSFERVHVDVAAKIARLAKEMGVERYFHISHLNAQPKPTPIYIEGGSKFLRSKYVGELAVREEFPEATILKPADIFGSEDRFIHYYASRWRRAYGTIPLWKGGRQTIKSPVFCSNVAEGIINAIYEPESVGQTYECVGPSRYYLRDLVEYMYRVMRFHNVHIIPITPFFKMKVAFMSRAPNYPILTLDKLDREHLSDEVSGLPTLEDLGVKLVNFEDRIVHETKIHRRLRYQEDKIEDLVMPDPPPVVN